MRRIRNAKVVATLGPSSSSREVINDLFLAGADVFRLNFSHGTHEDHAQRLTEIRAVEKQHGRPIGVLLDLQGPKLRIGAFAGGKVSLSAGDKFRLDLSEADGSARRVHLPHPEIFAALREGSELLLDDGKIRLRVDSRGEDFAETTVLNGGPLSNRKGVNVPDVMLPLSAMTEKDRRDLEFGLELGVDWVALSFVQCPEDVREIKKIVNGRAGVIAKLEKPAAIQSLDEIVREADAVMVARGDLGVEMPAEQVPSLQKQIIRACRKAGKPVIVATQMLESMIASPVPTRAEASDVATAVYDGADAVMLSAESASGQYPVEAVQMMNGIIKRTESDPLYHDAIEASHTPPNQQVADAISNAVRHIAQLLKVPAAVAYTSSGYSALRMARERPAVPIVGMTPLESTARRLALAWGVHAVLCQEVEDVVEMTDLACQTVLKEKFGSSGLSIVISAGLPFTVAGTTNLLRIAQIH
ncbi:pyruvate kinase [Cupriavidus sp. a3]|uniref:pyruvate kinase n=1 Tax=Cupriavidus sp. a3 TaxID=3242158 RepID=UPI003D9C330A